MEMIYYMGATQKYDVTDIKIYAFDSSNEKIFAKVSTYNGMSTVEREPTLYH